VIHSTQISRALEAPDKKAGLKKSLPMAASEIAH
jgi:hypothetical protein